ncbi:type II toxin-antitoxin system VapC family toxin [Asticcacaulis sp. W401b]|uniref:type II toxin-antitoxin system VapC family toxin n=1 Tax=Asticcacaulis sp. W401b TaxID=3388666 RepID=UPI003970AE67
MIILDTNVISELLRPTPDQGVVAWIEARPRGQFFTTAVSEAEIRYGIARLEDGRRRQALTIAIEGIFTEDFAGRILAFDSGAAVTYAAIVSARDRIGRPISQFDAQISAIALAHGAAIATRNAKDFECIGVEIINPWPI